MPDPYAPVRQSLRDLSGTIERGATRRADRTDKRSQMALNQQMGLAGLDLQNRRLGMTQESHDLDMQSKDILLKEQQKEQTYLDTPSTRFVDPDRLSAASNALFGAERGENIVKSVVDKLDPNSVEVFDDGNFNLTMTNREWKRWAEKLKGAKSGSKFMQDDKGEQQIMLTDGRSFGTGIFTPVEHKRTFAQEKELAGIKAGGEKPLTRSQKINYKQEELKYVDHWYEETGTIGESPEQEKIAKKAIAIQYRTDTLPGYQPPRKSIVRTRKTKDGTTVYFNAYGKAFEDSGGRTPYVKAGSKVHRQKIGN